jgi:RNA polymerase sigma-70 factor (sigma-E family)
MEFEAFVQERLAALVGFTAALCGDRALAEDVVQEVLIRVQRRWPAVANLDAPEAYVRKALVHEYLSWRRKWWRIIPAAEVHPPGPDAPDHAEVHAQRSQLADRIAALPPRQRAVLVLRYYTGLTDSEIAETLGCRPVTVRGYASRALATLRVELGQSVTADHGSTDAD